MAHKKMVRPAARGPVVQPVLFDADLVEENNRLTFAYQHLAEEHAALTQRLAHLQAECTTLQAESKRLQAHNDQLSQTLKHWRAISPIPTPKTSEVSREDLTRLLTLCHPDKWQGQPAERLAHELAVVVNQWRAGAQL